ncbi:glycosyltransferase [Pelosinus sp. sgz500959]|uniref:O-linked N-acetylglucosamine transferase family protein n=1 Tax=Pelosinus sp. sgz500959 TaxID=3242472 RepID=UPI0036733C1A
MNTIKIVHINLFDYQGGAARIAWTIMENLAALGHQNHIFAHRKVTNDVRVIPISIPNISWQGTLLAKQQSQGIFDLYSAALLGVFQHPAFIEADVVHLHCINGGYFSYLLLPFLAAKPLVWTMHDPLAFTAGCLQTDTCNGWKQGCSDCSLDQPHKGPNRQFMQQLKENIYQVADFVVVNPSQWIHQQAQNSILQGHDMRLIYNGIDINIFHPGNSIQLRNQLGLPLQRKIIMFAAHGGFNSRIKGGSYLIEALQQLHIQYPDLLLLNIGTYDQSIIDSLPIETKNISYIGDPKIMAKYYGAADLFVQSSTVENLSLAICEAMACGTPVVAFDIGGNGEIIEHLKTGYLAQRGSSSSLAAGIQHYLDNPELILRTSQLARKYIVDQFDASRMTDQYLNLYQELIGQRVKSMPKEKPADEYQELLETYQIPQTIEIAKSRGWGNIFKEFKNKLYGRREDKTFQRGLYVDLYLSYCLRIVDVETQSLLLIEVIDLWLKSRNMPPRCGGMPKTEFRVILYFCRCLREKLRQYFIKTSLESFVQIPGNGQIILLQLWRQVFLNAFSPLHLTGNFNIKPENCEEIEEFLEKSEGWYPKLLLASMYQPYSADKYPINVEKVLHAPIPSTLKASLAFWMVATPYFNGTERQRLKLLYYGEKLSKVALALPQPLPKAFFNTLTEDIMAGFWRVSYLGGNHVQALSSFGDFISHSMQQIYPHFSNIRGHRNKSRSSKKIRVGYISRNFCSQAVSYYMVNRILHHDRNQFELFIFALGERKDEMTDSIIENSEHFYTIPDLNDIGAIAQQVSESELDLLIYTDIGMDSVTYMLAGLQLAPVQCALVGHGTTTGLPTIQYYISGDFEAPEADSHYREKLIRLPNLGAAQYPPENPTNIPTRKKLNIPEDAVVFISCANGIKHGPDRDQLLMKILQKASKAWIILKPFQNPITVDHSVTRRLVLAARKAGVEKRLIILPPLAKTGDVIGLLTIADIQLDTYPYGGWTTNMDALYAGLPIITQEGSQARTRWGSHLLRALEIEAGIAKDENAYVDWAVQLAEDGELRCKVSQQIKERAKEILFDGRKAQFAYEQVLFQITNTIIGQSEED